MSGINNQDSREPIVGATQELPTSQNTSLDSREDKQPLTTSAKVTIYFSYLTILGSIIASWDAYESERANELLAGLAQAIYLGLAVMLNFVMLLVHIVRAKNKGESVSKRAILLFMAPIIIFIGATNIGGAVNDYRDSKPSFTAEQEKAMDDRQARLKKSIEEEQEKEQMQKVNLLKQYGFYYLTDDVSNIDQFGMNSMKVNGQPSHVSLGASFANYKINLTRVNTISQIAAKVPSDISGLPCYGAQSFFERPTACVKTSSTFAGYPIYKSTETIRVVVDEEHFYYLTNGKLFIRLIAVSDDKAVEVANQLKLIDDQSGLKLAPLMSE